MDDNAIEVQHEEHYRQLVFICGPAAFKRVRARLFEEANAIDEYSDADIRWIALHLPPKEEQEARLPYVRLVGCLLGMLLLGMATCIGLNTIWNWLTAP